MSLNELMGGTKKVIKMHVNDIRLNSQNKYDLTEIEALAKTIKDNGQLENGVGYYEDKNDGKKITLVAGHRRHSAISLLYRRNESDGLMDIKIVDKPKTVIEEELLIVRANNQRRKTKEQRLREVDVALRYYESLSDVEKPKFNDTYKLRDYIGELIGITGRQAQKYMNSLRGKEKQDTEKKESKYLLTDLKNKLEHQYQCKVRVTGNSISFSCQNTEELNKLFETLGIQEVLDKEKF